MVFEKKPCNDNTNQFQASMKKNNQQDLIIYKYSELKQIINKLYVEASANYSPKIISPEKQPPGLVGV